MFDGWNGLKMEAAAAEAAAEEEEGARSRNELGLADPWSKHCTHAVCSVKSDLTMNRTLTQTR